MVNTKSLTILLTIFSIAILSPNFLEADTSIQEHDFGNVEVDSTVKTSVNISTSGAIALSGIKLTSQDSFCGDMTLSPYALIGKEPIILEEYGADYIYFPWGFSLDKDQILTVEIIYSPSAPGECLRILGIYPICPPSPTGCEPIDEVFFIGMGVEKEPDNITELLLNKLQDIIDYTNGGYAYQTFKSSEHAQDTSSKRRFESFQGMLYITYHLIENGNFEAACNKLNSIYKRTNGKPGPDPNDFVPPDKTRRLASMLRDLISSFDSIKSSNQKLKETYNQHTKGI